MSTETQSEMFAPTEEVPLLKYKKLGKSGLNIAPLIIGCMSYGSKNWSDWVMDDEEKIFGILKKAYDNGLRTFDTADLYSNGKSEILLGKFLKKYNIPREKVVILTKVFFPVHPDPEGPLWFNFNMADSELSNSMGLSRKHIFDAVEASIKRLGTYIDVLQIHRLDSTPKTEIMRSLNDVVSQGYARYIGASTMKAVDFAQLQFIAEKHNWVKFISMQNYYNLLYREEEREMVPFCKDNEFGEVGLIPWSPIARGLLARPWQTKSEFGGRSESDQYTHYLGNNSAADKAIVDRVEELSKKRGVSMAVISTSWVIQKGATPIVGVNSEARIDDLLKAVTFKLTEEEIQYLEEEYVPKKVQQ